MSGGGGSSSDSGGGNEQAAAKAAMTTQAAYSTGSYNKSYNPGAGGVVTHSNRDESDQQNALKTYHENLEDYDEPDRDHFNQTQKEIKQRNKELAKSGQLDTSMTKEQYDQFNKELNEYYGTENVKYEPYGRAGKGTVNLTFKEHYENVGMQSPLTKYSPFARFLIASGRNAKEALTSDYGTYKYGGPGTDQGGLLGRIGGSGADISLGATQGQRDVMNELAPEAPYIVSGLTRPTNSPAANWYQSLGNTNTSGFNFSFANELNAAKAKQKSILGTPSAVGYLAVNQSPFYDWLKTNSLDKGIL